MKKPLFIHYAGCGTCVKAAKWLAAHGIGVDPRDIITQRPSRGELEQWVPMSGLPIRKFFNTSGLVYKSLGLKDRVATATDSELLDLLASDGKLVKRPVLVTEDRVLVGFKEPEWAELFGVQEIDH